MVEARSAVRDRLNGEGLGTLGSISRFVSVADALEDLKSAEPDSAGLAP